MMFRIPFLKTSSDREQAAFGSPVSGIDSSVLAQKAAPFDTIAAFVFLVGVFLLPLFFLVLPGVPVEFSKTIFLALMAVATLFLWFLGRLKSGIFVFPRHLLFLAGLVLVFVFFLSAVLSPTFSVSFSGFVYEIGTVTSMMVLFFLMFLASTLLQSQRLILYFYGALFLSFSVVFLFQILRLFLGVDFLSFGVFTNTIASMAGKWNDLGVFAGMIALLSLLALEFSPFEGRFRFLSYAFLFLSLFLLAVVNFFLVWVVVGAIALIIVVYNFSLGQLFQKESHFPVVSIIVLLLSVLFLVFGSSIGAVLTEYTGINHVEVRPSWSSTFSIIGNTWKEDLFLGSGPHRFSAQWLMLKPDIVNTTPFWATEFTSGIGLLPTFAVTTGIVGVLGWLFFFASFLYAGFQSLFTAGTPTMRYLSVSSFATSFYLWILSIFYVPNAVFFALAFLFTGVFVALLVQQGLSRNFVFSVARDPRLGFVSVLLVIVLLVASVLGAYTIFEKTLSLTYLHKGRAAFSQEGDYGKAEDYVLRATQVNNSDNLFRLLADIQIARLNGILTQNTASIEKIRAEFQDTLGRAISAGQEAVQIDGTNYANWDALGRVYSAVVPLNISGAYENAEQSFRRASELNPRGPAVALSQARLELMRGNNKEARVHINRALALKPNYADATFLLAQLEINEGNVRAAIASLEQGALINPNDVSLFFRLGILKYNDRDYTGAIAALERAIFLSPNYSNAKYFLGLAYYYKDRVEDAITQFKDIESLNPENEEVKKILVNLGNKKSPFTGIIPPGETPVRRDQAPISE